MMNPNKHPDNASMSPHLSSTDKLIQAGLIAADAQPLLTQIMAEKSSSANALDSDNATPWFLQLFLGASGFFAGVAIIAFIAILMSSQLDETGVQVSVGLILLFISLALFKSVQDSANTFLGSLAFAFSVAGQVFICLAIFDNNFSTTISTVTLMLFQIIMAFTINNLAHRIANFCIALGCVVWLFSYYNAPELTAGFLALLTCIFGLQRYEWLHSLGLESIKLRTTALQISRAMTYASALMLLGVSVYVIASEYRHIGLNYGYYHYPLAQGVLILASGYAAYLILRRYNLPLRSQAGMMTLVAITILGAVSVFVSGLLASSVVIVIAMANRQRVLMVLGIIALVSYVFWYYYQLDTPLFIKSISMLVVGIVLLMIRQILRRVMPMGSTSASTVTATPKGTAL